jgi:hypothetical protein
MEVSKDFVRFAPYKLRLTSSDSLPQSYAGGSRPADHSLGHVFVIDPLPFTTSPDASGFFPEVALTDATTLDSSLAHALYLVGYIDIGRVTAWTSLLREKHRR